MLLFCTHRPFPPRRNRLERIVDPKYRFAFSFKTGRPYHRKCYWENLYVFTYSTDRVLVATRVVPFTSLHEALYTAFKGQRGNTLTQHLLPEAVQQPYLNVFQQQISSSNLCRQHLCPRARTKRRTPRRTTKKNRSGNRRNRFSNHDQTGHRRRAWQLCIGRNHALSRPRRGPNPVHRARKRRRRPHCSR